MTLRRTIRGSLDLRVSLKNLPPGEHAIHQNSLCEALDFKSAGGYFNPTMKQHGTMNPLGHHSGDLPQNMTVDEARTGAAGFTVRYLSLTRDAQDSILGRSFVGHDRADDMKTDPTGNAGNRIACGVIDVP